MTVRTPVAVIDMGSNSSRIVVFREDAGHVLEVIADEHVPLQLIRGLDKNGRLREPVAEKALGLLRDSLRCSVCPEGNRHSGSLICFSPRR